MSDVIGANLDLLFPNVPVLDRCTFRVTRNAEVRRNEDVAEGLISAIEGVLRDRRFATVVRLELETSTPDRVRELLIERLGLDDREVLTRPGPLDFGDLDALVDLDRPKLKLEPWTPRPHPRLGESGRDDFFAEVRRREVLVHHPYHSFEGTVQAFLTAAARDPDVLAVKVAIYRTAPDSEVVEALLEAARNGKQVAVMVELRARFDEANNLRWVRRLEEEGVHVAYGDIGLKTHSKVALVVREEDDGESGPAVRTYAHVGTGNYHAGTAKGYVDLGLLTADSDVGQDLVRLFNSFTAHAAAAEYRKLLVAPTTLRSEMTDRVRRETDRAREGEPAGITAVMNSLEDPAMVRELYRASRAGVDVDLVVRGICRLRPGVSGLSESVTVRSIVGRFLEHSRVFRFENGGDREYFIGSADWMTRNLDRRVEAVVPVEDPDHRAYLDYVLTAMLADDRKAWVLDGDGGYTQLRPEGDEDGESVHDRLMRLARAATEGLTVGSELRNGDVG
jgi:polyphosphate kinase